ncbi:hypothetical protein GBK02_11275 [Dechloromonas sp. TW-R-39-2]|uniref:hypothetical protein n=1 Tax=Dechloromonas sp. TW-R-39-2 TaxID=2654218 RepID=UPI00193CC8BD|nr:hypothetical protein [Dechloromonas sp. TW-R-39-2]QRM19943.1 hypothetical protein GBK02_11275 [Dechloromonas sp. TW-R-39-2]
MEKILFPPDLLNRPGIWALPAEHKLMVVVLANHHSLTPCLLFAPTPYSCRGLPLPVDVIWGILTDLDQRGLAVVSQNTCEAYLCGSFSWHRSPAEEEVTPWARQVRTALAGVRDSRVAEAIRADLERYLGGPRVPSVLLYSNLLTALPPRGPGQQWSATEMLAAFVLAANPDQTASGVFRPGGWLDGLADLASVPATTFAEVLASLQGRGAAASDAATGEIFIASRLRCAKARDAKKIFEEAEQIISPLIFRIFSQECKLRKIKIPENQRVVSQERGGEVSIRRGEVVSDQAAAEIYQLRHGPWKGISLASN